jgi:ubiquinone/menaquinone biosynthesis C-methylase UbiE
MNAYSVERQAVALHSRLAESFSEGYETTEAPDTLLRTWRQLFAYSRKRLDTYLFPALERAGRRVLDVGCGPGQYVRQLRNRGFDVAGIDGSAEMLSVARANNPGVELRQGRVQELPFPDGSFDAVTSIEVLRYVPDWPCCVQEMARVLKPGGVCLITMSPKFNLNGYWLINWIDSILPIPSLKHLRQFFVTSWQLRRVFKEAGFERPAIRGLYFGPSNWIARIFPGMVPAFLRWCEPIDRRLSDVPWLSNLSNICLVSARKPL